MAAHHGVRELASHGLGSIFDSQMEGILADMILPALQQALKTLQVCFLCQAAQKFGPEVKEPEDLAQHFNESHTGSGRAAR